MKLATFNINNVNKRLANLLEWLERESPDVVCLQELKARHNQFPTKRALPRQEHDSQARYIEAAVQGVLVGCI